MQELADIFKTVLRKLYNVSGVQNLSAYSLLILVAITIAAFIIEYFSLKDKSKSSVSRIRKFDRSIVNDIIAWIIDALGLFTLGGVLLTLGSIYFVTVLIYKHPEFHFQLAHYIQHPVLNFIVLFLLRDLKTYWVHRLFHRFEPLWQLHEMHHSADKFSIISAHRGHFVEGMISGFFDALVFMIVGGPLINLVLVNYLTELHFLITHSNIKHPWGLIGRYILVSPHTHRLHHSANPVHFNKNYGGIFIIWDKLFGTYCDTCDGELELGVPHSHYNKKGYLYDVLYSYYKFVKLLFSPVVQIVQRIWGRSDKKLL